MDFAQSDSLFKTIVDTANHYVWGYPEIPWLVVALIGTGLFLTIRMGFIQFRKLGHAMKVVSGKYDDPHHQGDISHFQALTTALSATVGIGNIAGVATAIHFGGPGAVFWMWVTALVGMCTKHVEVTLSMKYRKFDAAGNSSGGPHRYILSGLGHKWKPLAVFFALCGIISSFGAGNMNQINTLAAAAKETLNIPNALTGGIAVVLVGAVILGGINRIGKVTSILCPSMALVYTLGALGVILSNLGELPGVFTLIFEEAFNPTAGFAGTAAGVWSVTLLWGVKRGLFSNEAGQGSAPIAHAAAKTDMPVREGVVAMMGPFIDTICICSMTAIVILVSGYWNEPLPQEIDLDDKDLSTYSWSDEALSLTAFGAAREAKSTSVAAQSEGEEKKKTLTLRVLDGVAVGLFDQGRRLSSAVFVRNDAPILDALVKRNGAPFSGELSLSAGVIALPKDSGQGSKTAWSLHGKMIQNGQSLTSAAFQKGLGDFGGWIVTLTVVLFALSTAISWSYYGDRCTEFLFGIRGVSVYRFLFLGFVFLGAVLPLQVVWDFGDLALGLMTLPNLIAIVLLSRQVRTMQDEYFEQDMTPPKR